MTLSEFGAFIYGERLDQELSQQELATRAGMSINTLARVEHHKNVSLENASAILNELGYKLEVVPLD